MKLCLPSETLCPCLLKASADAGTMSLDSQPQSPELNNSSFFINCCVIFVTASENSLRQVEAFTAHQMGHCLSPEVV